VEEKERLAALQEEAQQTEERLEDEKRASVAVRWWPRCHRRHALPLCPPAARWLVVALPRGGGR
jgi:hypothetical protein